MLRIAAAIPMPSRIACLRTTALMPQKPAGWLFISARSKPAMRKTDQIGLKARRLDGIDAPNLAKNRPDSGLRYGPRSPIATLLVAGANQEVGGAPPNASPGASPR